MAQRIYKTRVISPEIARENAISAAKSSLAYARTELAAAQALADRIAAHGAVAADAIGDEITPEIAARRVAARVADVQIATQHLAETEAA